MKFSPEAWILICFLVHFTKGYCLYGDSEDCFFKCHCAKQDECAEGLCPSGCQTAALGYDWRGRGCQIGNVGLHKNATMRAGYFTAYPASGALDGFVPSSQITKSCAHPAGYSAEWTADLGDVYKIYNITIYGRPDCCEHRLQQFDLKVYNESTNKVLCAHYDPSIKTQATISCGLPVIGRYVEFKRTGGIEIDLTTLCEVVIIGHKYVDCSRCPPGVGCNDVTGCESCVGAYQPDCRTACQARSYGTNCKETCGNCKDNSSCDVRDGTCQDGCQLWWSQARCDKYIAVPTYSNETLTITETGSNYISVDWQHLSKIDPDLATFYGYSLQYREKGIGQNYMEAARFGYDSQSVATIRDLTKDTEYEIRIVPYRVFGDRREFAAPYPALTVSTGKSSNLAAIIAGLVCLVISIVTAIVIVFIIWKRRKSNLRQSIDQPGAEIVVNSAASMAAGKSQLGGTLPIKEGISQTDLESVVTDMTASDDGRRQDNEEGLYVNSSVAVVNFEGYVSKRMAKIGDLFDEFKTLAQPDLSRCKKALEKDNKQKNRYKNIYAYDETRVILEGDATNDYINASYITGFNKKREYIATQGTKVTTQGDFWRMIWQEKANRIVMLANVTEMGKQRINPYWPEKLSESIQIGDFFITTEAIQQTADYLIRTMTVERKGECRTVHQFHFTSWKDKDRPLYGCFTLQAFINKVHSYDDTSQGPLVVHCSAGVGRTGTFIALDILEQTATKQKAIDVYDCVKRLRHERVLMVQTKEQYVFLHEALVDFIKSPHSSTTCSHFLTEFSSVCNPNPDKQLMSRIEEEFRILNNLKPSAQEGKGDGFKADNLHKNRNIEVIPDDQHRIFLSRANTGNYINAVEADSFKRHDSYVVTQMPLTHTIADFWQLVVEERCHAIVMLNELDSNEETSGRYWPMNVKDTRRHERVEVELVSEAFDDPITVRDLKVTESFTKNFSKPQTLTIRQFQLLSWPEGDLFIPNKNHLFVLMEKLRRWQYESQVSTDEWKVLVHCNDGGSRSGLFCGVSFLLDKMNSAQDVDAFLAARYVSRNRPQFFTKLSEYTFLYQMAMEQLKLNNDYANFF